MTEKRFVNIDGEMLYDTLGEMETIYHNDRVYFRELCDFLNELSEENERLKKQINELINGIQETSKMSADAVTKQWRGGI